MTEQLRQEFMEKLELAKKQCYLLIRHHYIDEIIETGNKIPTLEEIMAGLEIFHAIDYTLMSGDKVIKLHIQMMDFILRKLSERMAENGVTE